GCGPEPADAVRVPDLGLGPDLRVVPGADGMNRDAAVAALPTGAAIVDGRSADGTGSAFRWVHPGDGTTYAERSLAGPVEIESAVAAAKAAIPSWSAATGSQRREALLGVAAALRAHADELAALVSLEMGMPVSAA